MNNGKLPVGRRQGKAIACGAKMIKCVDQARATDDPDKKSLWRARFRKHRAVHKRYRKNPLI